MQTSSFLAENIEILGTIVSTIKEEQKLNGDKIYRTDIRCINEKNEAY
jgi:S-ribosylhomocysteine lyase LuxS involved in autoinducer biosynthesis